MDRLKAIYIPTLLELLELGAHHSPIALSTIELARRLGKSQQAASKHLLDLERKGYVERFKSGSRSEVRITKRGLDALTNLYSSMKLALEGVPKSLEFRGFLFSGLGEGAYYVSLRGYRRQFIRKLGFDPYPGTLNLKLSSLRDRRLRSELKGYKGIFIESFEDRDRTYGWVRVLRAVIEDRIEGAVLSDFERTHYDDSVLEILAPVNIRRSLGLKDGDMVKVKVLVEDE